MEQQGPEISPNASEGWDHRHPPLNAGTIKAIKAPEGFAKSPRTRRSCGYVGTRGIGKTETTSGSIRASSAPLSVGAKV